jgi:hypothetical protein
MAIDVIVAIARHSRNSVCCFPFGWAKRRGCSQSVV